MDDRFTFLDSETESFIATMHNSDSEDDCNAVLMCTAARRKKGNFAESLNQQQHSRKSRTHFFYDCKLL